MDSNHKRGREEEGEGEKAERRRGRRGGEKEVPEGSWISQI